MQRDRSEPRPIALWVALTLSVLLHALFVIFTLWIPLSTATTEAMEAEESLLRFSFAQPTDRDVDGQRGGTIPIPQDVPSTRPPDTRPPDQPGPRSPSNMAQPQQAAVAPAVEAPTTERARPIEPAEEPLPTPERETLEVAPLDEVAKSAPHFPEEGADPILEREPQPATPSAPTSPSTNAAGRIRNFNRALQRAIAAQPPPGAGGGGGSSAGVFVPEPSAVPSSGFGVGNLVFESKDYDWSDYGRQIYMAIWRAWHNRLYLSLDNFERWGHQSGIWNLGHEVQVRFEIPRTGDVTGILIEADSGCVPLDRSAVDALDEVILPPLPSDFPRDIEIVHARFIAIGSIPAMRPSLTYLKHQGLF